MKCFTEPENGSRNDLMCLFLNFEKGCGHTGLPRPFHTEQKPTNEFCFWVAQILLVDKRNREFFPEKFSRGVEMSFLKMLTLIFIDGVILHLEIRSFEPFEITFLKKSFYFAYLLTKRENLSYSEAKLICWFSLCMKWVWQASMATPFFKIRK